MKKTDSICDAITRYQLKKALSQCSSNFREEFRSKFSSDQWTWINNNPWKPKNDLKNKATRNVYHLVDLLDRAELALATHIISTWKTEL